MKIIISLLASLQTIFLFALNPVREYAHTPGDFGLTFEEVSIQTADNLTLKGWYLTPKNISYKIVIISHNGNGNMSDMIEIASQFVSLGYNVLTYDYRGYGKSSDFEIKQDFFIYAQFEKDLNAAIDHVKKFYSKSRNINLYGVGIGASLSLSIGAMRSDQVSKIIADSPYFALEDVKKDIKTATGKDVLLPLGYDKLMLEPKHALQAKGGSLTGILLIAGDKEQIFSVKVAKEISKLRSSITQLYIVKGATCDETFSKNKEEYFAQIKKIL